MSTNDTRIRVMLEDLAGDEVGIANGALTVVGPTGASSSTVQGTAADGAAAVGNPVRIGGKDGSGNTQDILTGTDGALVAGLHTASSANADAQANSLHVAVNAGAVNVARVWTRPELFNGTTYDRPRNNTDLTILASAARTATNQSSDITNYNGRGMHLVIDVTAASATPSVVFTIQGKDVLSGKYYTILASSAITGTGTTVLKVHPGITAAANASVSDLLPRTWRVDATHADADSITYSVGASVIV